MQTSRELVQRSLTFGTLQRLPRDIWVLPWFERHYPNALRRIQADFPSDIVDAPGVYRKSPRVNGSQYEIGRYVDEWGCEFTNAQDGIIGEVKKPLVEDLAALRSVRPPCETLPENAAAARDIVNGACAATDKFVKAPCCARPWERYQFLRGTQSSLIDIMMPDEGARDLLKIIHEFYLEELRFWVSTDVDGIMFMDDWGSQNQLLISPTIWRELFKPLYKEYCDLAHSRGKSVFMHSDGCIIDIYDDIIEIGVDALNSQLFCMDMAVLAKKAMGRIAFWGEIDRQHVLPSTDPQTGRDAVRTVARNLYDTKGGVIIQFECGPGANPETIRAVLDEWESVQKR
jgi:hypothetical protein